MLEIQIYPILKQIEFDALSKSEYHLVIIRISYELRENVHSNKINWWQH